MDPAVPPAVVGLLAAAPPGQRWDLRAVLGALILLAGGLLLVASELAEASGIRLIVGVGLSLTTSGWVDRRRPLYLEMGGPILGLGLGALAADQFPVLPASVEPFVLAGLGAGLLAADAASRGHTAWGASGVLILAALGTAAVVASSSAHGGLVHATSGVVAWWAFGAAQATVGATLAFAAVLGWTLPARAPSSRPAIEASSVRASSPVRQTIAGAILVVGGLTITLIELDRNSLVEVIPAIGVANILVGWVDGRRGGHIDSGTALVALGLVLKLDDVETLTPYFEALVLGGFGTALLLLQRGRPGPHPRFGRSILTVGIVYAVIEVLPDYVSAPGLWSAAYSGGLFAILVAVSGACLAIRAWLPPGLGAPARSARAAVASLGRIWRH